MIIVKEEKQRTHGMIIEKGEKARGHVARSRPSIQGKDSGTLWKG